MKVLVIGGGGREHAMGWKLKQSKKVDKVYCTPGNAGIAEMAEVVDIKPDDFDALLDFVKYNWVDLTVVGPEVQNHQSEAASGHPEVVARALLPGREYREHRDDGEIGGEHANADKPSLVHESDWRHRAPRSRDNRRRPYPARQSISAQHHAPEAVKKKSKACQVGICVKIFKPTVIRRLFARMAWKTR